MYAKTALRKREMLWDHLHAPPLIIRLGHMTAKVTRQQGECLLFRPRDYECYVENLGSKIGHRNYRPTPYPLLLKAHPIIVKGD